MASKEDTTETSDSPHLKNQPPKDFMDENLPKSWNPGNSAGDLGWLSDLLNGCFPGFFKQDT